MAISLKVIKLVDNELALSGYLMHSMEIYSEYKYIQIYKDDYYVTTYKCKYSKSIPEKCISMGSVQRSYYGIYANSEIMVSFIKNLEINPIEVSMCINYVKKEKLKNIINENEIIKFILNKFNNLSHNQCLCFKYKDIFYKIITTYENYKDGEVINCTSNIINNITTQNPLIIIENDKKHKILKDMYKEGFSFETVGIGGLDEQLEKLFKYALSSRAYTSDIIKKFGIKHSKGLLLYGPPGTGKTLIARNIGKLLSPIEPKIINGPEILNKYVGESESNVRKIFIDAEKDYKSLQDNSPLHIIIFDEIDAICKKRGSQSSSTGVGDNIVNQLLTKIDGVEALNNIFIIAMTNRKDLIDEALLRAGRIEHHIKIDLPDAKGREQIFRIHTNCMRENSMLGKDVNIKTIARLTNSYTGAEIENIIKQATSNALYKNINKEDDIIVTMEDFNKAIKSYEPMFGSSHDKIKILLTTKNITEEKKDECKEKEICEEILKNPKTKVRTCLFNCKFLDNILMYLHKYEYTLKLITNDDLIGKSDTDKINLLTKIMSDCRLAKNSIICITDLDNIISYSELGGCVYYSNSVLQCIISLIKSSSLYDNNMTFIFVYTNNTVGNYIKKYIE